MKRRLKNKRIKKLNLETKKQLINELSKYFTVLKHNVINNHIWNRKNSFQLKETPGWVYTVFPTKTLGLYEILAKHQDLLLRFGNKNHYIDENMTSDELIEDINKIKDNPKLYFVDSYRGGALYPYKEVKYGEKDCDILYSGYQAVTCMGKNSRMELVKRDETITQEEYVNYYYEKFYKDVEEEKRQEKFARKAVYLFLNLTLKNLCKEVRALGIYEYSEHTYPRYEIKAVVDENLTDRQIFLVESKLRECIDKQLNFIRQNTRIYYKHLFRLVGCYRSVNSILDTNYKYYK